MPVLETPTPHIGAPSGAFAPDLLFPGDPLRARWVAEHLLADARCVTGLRGMLGFTGTWRGHPVSVMGSGMGLASSGIYATELVRGYGVRRLLRVGTCAAVLDHVDVGDLLLALGAGTDSSANRLRFGGYDCPATASWPLAEAIVGCARRTGRLLRVGNVFSTELFYATDPALPGLLRGMGILGVDMETAGLYAIAASLGVQAAALLTVSDHLVRGQHLAADDREGGLAPMLALALDALAGGA